MISRMSPALLKARPGASYTIVDSIEATAARHPNDVALVMGDSSMTYAQLDRRANRVARWALRQGLRRGKVVSLLGANRPEYVAHWLGLAKVGVVTALINNNLTGKALSHSVGLARSEHLVADTDLGRISTESLADLDDRPLVWLTGGPDPHADFDQALDAESPHPLEDGVRDGLTTDDNLFLIYTSGTTGMPKAAIFSHMRFLAVANAARAMTGYRRDDNIYSPLPLYHTVGGVMATGGALVSGATVVLAPRFSASNFWSDCVTHEATAFQYIGELCRYLLNSPAHRDERRHQIRVCIGNGLRPDIWQEFADRFGLDHIVEFYGATEGNVTFFNLDDKVGSIGRSTSLMRRAAGVRLILHDIDNQVEVRDSDGYCVEAAVGEPGEAIGKITAAARFEGYSEEAASERKILRNVFKQGDAYFRTGDLLERDADDYFYFVDRIGDTFRWNGENVSTTEVSDSLSSCKGLLEINVYGVEIPNHDGRAGMAMVVTDSSFELAEFAKTAANRLPSYARPKFLRMRSEIDVTGTLKYRKVDAVGDGFDPDIIDDPLFFLDPIGDCYRPLDSSTYQTICTGEQRI